MQKPNQNTSKPSAMWATRIGAWVRLAKIIAAMTVFYYLFLRRRHASDRQRQLGRDGVLASEPRILQSR